MKHDLKVTAILILFFVLAQVLGLALINYKMEITPEKIGYDETALGELPEMNLWQLLLYMVIGITVGTLLVLLIIKFKKVRLWKVWFFLAVSIAITLALGAIIPTWIALLLAILLTALKMFKPNIIIHNLTEILMYAGIALFIVGLFKDEVLGVIIILVLISIYDFIAVFKSKHMVKMAKFQTKSKVFAGLLIPYTPNKKGHGLDMKKIVQPPKSLKAVPKAGKEFPKIKEKKNALLGGGDIAFPLIFTGVVMHQLAKELISSGIASEVVRTTVFYQSLIITLTTTIALALLFIFAKKDKFYPAMPIISAGCFIGYFIVLLL